MDAIDSSPHHGLAAVARSHHGLFTLDEACAVGLTHDAIRHACDVGRYERLTPGLFRIAGTAVTWEQRVLAPILAHEGHAFAARLTALALHGLPRVRRSGPPHVVLPYGRSVRFTLGAVAHRSRSLDPDLQTEVDGIPVTAVARSLVEHGIDGVGLPWRDRVSDAIRMKLVTRQDVLNQLDILGRIPNRERMRRFLEKLDARATRRSRSQPEVVFVDTVTGAGLPRPVVNHEILGPEGRRIDEIDAAYPDWLLGFELDSDEFHSQPSQQRRDRAKDIRLTRLWWLIHRVPVVLLKRNPTVVVDLVRDAIEQAQARLPTIPREFQPGAA